MNQVADGGCIADRHGKRSEEAEILNMTEPQAERWTIEPFGGEIEEQRNRSGIDRNIGMVEYVGAQYGLFCQFADCAAQLLHEGGRSRQCAAAHPSDHRFSARPLAPKSQF